MTWFNHNGIPARLFLKLDDVDDNGALLFASSPDVRFPTSVYQADYGYMDHTLQIPWRWKTPVLDFHLPYAVKRFEHLILDFEDYNGGVTVDWEVDGGRRSGSFLASIDTEMVWGDDGSNIERLWNDEDGSAVNGLYWVGPRRKPLVYALPPSARGKDIQFTFSCEETGNAPPILNQFGCQWYLVREMYPGKVKAET